MTRILRNKKGVTLVELLAVIVILGIIAAIAVPTIGGLISRQRENAAIATFTTIEEQALIFAVDDADGVFTLDDLVQDGFDLKANVLSYDGTTAILAADYDEITITVVGSVVTFGHATETELYINGFLVVAALVNP